MNTNGNAASADKKQKLLSNIFRYLSLITGTAILSFGMFNIHSRCGISEGGVLGISLLIYQWLHISPGISGFLLDAVCFGIGTLVMGKRFLGDSVIASFMYSCWYEIFEYSGPVLPDLTDLPLAAAVLGGLFVGIGCGIVVLNNCATGGDDALALTVNKLTGMKISLFYIFSDLVVLLLSMTYIQIYRIGWSMLTVVISSVIIEIVRKIGTAVKTNGDAVTGDGSK